MNEEWAKRADASATHVANTFAQLYKDGHISIREARKFLTEWDDTRNAPTLNNKTALEQFNYMTGPNQATKGETQCPI